MNEINIKTKNNNIGDEINYIQDIKLIRNIQAEYDGHFLVLFTAKTHRPGPNSMNDAQTIDYRDGNGSYKQWRDSDGQYWIYGFRECPFKNVRWKDCGTVINYHDGLYVGHVLELERMSEDASSTRFKWTSPYDGTVVTNIATPQDVIDNILKIKEPFVHGMEILDTEGTPVTEIRYNHITRSYW